MDFDKESEYNSQCSKPSEEKTRQHVNNIKNI